MSSITLYQAADQLAAILDQVDEDGALPAEYGDARELVAQRGAAVAAYIASRELEADAIEARLKEVAGHVKAQRNRAVRLREYLLFHMARTGITQIDSSDRLLTIKRYPERDESVEIFDQSMIPSEYLRVPPPPEFLPADKTAIKKAIKTGQDVPGARIVKRDRLEIK